MLKQEITEEHSIMLDSHGMLSFLSHTTQKHLSSGSTAHDGTAPPLPIINQEHASQTCS